MMVAPQRKSTYGHGSRKKDIGSSDGKEENEKILAGFQGLFFEMKVQFSAHMSGRGYTENPTLLCSIEIISSTG